MNFDNQTIAGLFSHIMMLRHEMQRIAELTRDGETKRQLQALLRLSLKMPGEEEEKK